MYLIPTIYMSRGSCVPFIGITLQTDEYIHIKTNIYILDLRYF